MPEYLSPGVYVEETSFRARSIEGVATSTAGFVGQCRYGPVEGVSRLVTSFEEFQRYFGGIDDLIIDNAPQTNYLAHAVNLFFRNGGRRVYIARVFRPADRTNEHRSAGTQMVSNSVRFRARYPGVAGNLIVEVDGIRTGNIIAGTSPRRRIAGVRAGDIVEVALTATPKTREIDNGSQTAATSQPRDPLDPARLYFVSFNQQGEVVLTDPGGTVLDYQSATAVPCLQRVTLTIRVRSPGNGREDAYQGLSTHPASTLFIGRVLRHEDPDNGVEPPADQSARVFLEISSLPTQTPQQLQFARDLLAELMASQGGVNARQTLGGGGDGQLCQPADYDGSGSGHTATGLAALAEVEDIAIVAAPDGAARDDPDQRQAIRNSLIGHCERLRYRMAILSAQQDADDTAIRAARSLHDSTYAALYFPWLVVNNPFNLISQSRDTLLVPPDGAIAGIYARSDVERGVHKAPANEVVRDVLRFSRNVNQGIQDVLNPEGINCLRFFEGRGYRLWGARTISSDPEWIYVNVRRLFIFLERSIDRGTQWAVFEPNNEQLWLKIRLTIESFLYDVWRTGALLGRRPEEAYFVRCDRTTMSQGDLDNGRLICLIGVAPTRPAEFVIFRIGQWTADASII